MQDQNEKENLHSLLVGVNRLIEDTLTQREEIKIMQDEFNRLFEEGHLTELRYNLELQSVIRAHKDVNFCLKSLERQKKLALWKLRELS